MRIFIMKIIITEGIIRKIKKKKTGNGVRCFVQLWNLNECQ